MCSNANVFCFYIRLFLSCGAYNAMKFGGEMGLNRANYVECLEALKSSCIKE